MSLTIANSSFQLALPIYPQPVEILGYAADDAFATDDVIPNETLQGVDSILSGGYVAYPTPLKFTLQADSPSIQIMDDWLNAMDQIKDAINAGALIAIPGLSKQWKWGKGFLTRARKMPDGKKLGQPQRYEIMFQSCRPQPLLTPALSFSLALPIAA